MAVAMGVHPSRISHIERTDRVTEQAAARYLAALRTLETVSVAPTSADANTEEVA
jgi:hypothetical protein